MTAPVKHAWRLDDARDLFDMLIWRPRSGQSHVNVGEMYCGVCRADRRMEVDLLFSDGVVGEQLAPGFPPDTTPSPRAREPRVPSMHADFGRALLKFTCYQCGTPFTAVVYPGPDRFMVSVHSSARGGAGTPNAPAAVAYYLDEAHRAHMVGANSAAVAMYRAALEQLLHQQGYTTGILNAKLQKLATDADAGAAPKWVADMPAPVLSLVKDLGNGAIHTNGGDITKQAALDAELVRKLEGLVAWLLQEVYELPAQRAAAIAALTGVAGTLTK